MNRLSGAWVGGNLIGQAIVCGMYLCGILDPPVLLPIGALVIGVMHTILAFKGSNDHQNRKA